MRNKNRAGFTLVELMVAMALTLFIMIILSQAFVTGLETFVQLKAIGDMQANLRSAAVLLRDDLAQDHFEGRRRLSDVTLQGGSQLLAERPQAGFFAVMHGSQNPTTAALWSAATPYAAGDMVISGGNLFVALQANTNVATTNTVFWSRSLPYVFEGVDSNGMPSYRATNHVLYMTVKRKGNSKEAFFTAHLPGSANNLTPFFSRETAYNVPVAPSYPPAPAQLNAMPDLTMTEPYPGGTTGFYSSQWAEVMYYLKRVGSTEEPNNPTSNIGTPTFELYRAQFVLVPDGTELRTGPNNLFVNGPPAGLDQFGKTTFAQMSCGINISVTNQFSTLLFFSPMDVALGSRMLPNVGNPNSIPVTGSGGLASFNPQGNPRSGPTNRVTLTETPVLPNVISFHIQVMPHNGISFADIPMTNIPPILVGAPTPRARIFDTTYLNVAAPSTLNGYQNTFGIKAIQITLRVWDNKTRQTRQVTIVQDM